MLDDRPGTASFPKAEPSATDEARLRRTLTEEQKTNLRQVIAARVRAFRPADTADTDGSLTE